MTISGILFDFDGTLANTTPLILHCFHQTFSHFYGKVPPDEKILTTFGLPMPQAMLQLSGGDEAHLDKLLTFIGRISFLFMMNDPSLSFCFGWLSAPKGKGDPFHHCDKQDQ